MIKIDESFKKSLINEYLKQPISLKDIVERYKCHIVTISKILKEANIPIYTKQQLMSIGLDEDYYD